MRNFKDPQVYALYLLELRDRSVGEISEKMKRKGFEEKEITQVISFLKEKNFLDDERFAKRFAVEKQKIYHWGQYRIKAELKKKHISDEMVADAFAEKSDESEFSAAHESAKSWRRKNPKCPKEKIYSRLGGFLSRRGFSYDIVKQVLEDNI